MLFQEITTVLASNNSGKKRFEGNGAVIAPDGQQCYLGSDNKSCQFEGRGCIVPVPQPEPIGEDCIKGIDCFIEIH